MANKQTFSERLKKLRGNIEATELARMRGVAIPTIYKAEGGERNVKWQTIEAIYGEFCKSPYELADLLMMWALTQTESKITPPQARESMCAVMEESDRANSEQGEAMLREMELMPPSEQRELVEFARKFRKSAPTRQMTKAWMAALKSAE